MRCLGRTGTIFESCCDDGHLSVDWDIRNFHSMSKKGGDYYESPTFSFNDELWCLSVYSDGMVRHQPSGWVGLFLERIDSGPSITVQFSLGITGAEGVEKRRELERKFTRRRTEFGIPEFLPRKVLTDHQLLMMPEGILTISFCMMKTVTKGISSYRGHQYPSDIFEVEDELRASRAHSGLMEVWNVQGTGSRDAMLCKLCMDEERCVVFQPCGHLISCWECSRLIADCPICRKHITHKIKTYFS